MRPVLVALAAGAVTFVLLLVFLGGLFAPPSLDTKTHSVEVAGFYGVGSFAGELLKSDAIETNITEGNMSQSIVFQGRVCTRVPNLGRIFLDGARITEPDAYYRVIVNGVEQFRYNMEAGGSSALISCYEFPEREYVITGSVVGTVRAELAVYVHSFEAGTGAYSVLAYDVAALR